MINKYSHEGFWDNIKNNVRATKLDYAAAGQLFKECAARVAKLGQDEISNKFNIVIDRQVTSYNDIMFGIKILNMFMKFFKSAGNDQDKMIGFCYDHQIEMKSLSTINHRSNQSLTELGYNKQGFITMLNSVTTLFTMMPVQTLENIENDMLAGWDSDVIFGEMMRLKKEVYSICKLLALIEQ